MKVNDQTIIFKIDNCAHYSVASCLEVDIVEILTKGNKILQLLKFLYKLAIIYSYPNPSKTGILMLLQICF